MQIRRCEHCNQIFGNKLSGAGSILCPECIGYCDDAYMPVYRCIKSQGFTSIDMISEIAEVHPALVKGLVLDGRFQCGEGCTDFDSLFDAQRRRQLLEMMGKEKRTTNIGGASSPNTQTRTTSSRRNYGLGAK